GHDVVDGLLVDGHELLKARVGPEGRTGELEGDAVAQRYVVGVSPERLLLVLPERMLLGDLRLDEQLVGCPEFGEGNPKCGWGEARGAHRFLFPPCGASAGVSAVAWTDTPSGASGASAAVLGAPVGVPGDGLGDGASGARLPGARSKTRSKPRR